MWRATDTILARPVAVKLLLADHVQHPQALARFRTEAQRAGSLTHENIARVYDYLEPEPPGSGAGTGRGGASPFSLWTAGWPGRGDSRAI